MGNMTEAESLFSRSLTIRERTLGPNHEDTIFSRNNLIEVLMKSKQFMVAEPILRQAVEIFTNVRGITNQATLVTMFNHGICLGALGRQDEVLPIIEKVAGEVVNCFAPNDEFVQKVKTTLARLRSDI
jgi:hypothetical protein